MWVSSFFSLFLSTPFFSAVWTRRVSTCTHRSHLSSSCSVHRHGRLTLCSMGELAPAGRRLLLFHHLHHHWLRWSGARQRNSHGVESGQSSDVCSLPSLRYDCDGHVLQTDARRNHLEIPSIGPTLRFRHTHHERFWLTPRSIPLDQFSSLVCDALYMLCVWSSLVFLPCSKVKKCPEDQCALAFFRRPIRR